MTNRSFLYCVTLLLFNLIGQRIVAQVKTNQAQHSFLSEADSSQQISRILNANPRLVQIGDSLWIISGICKPLLRIRPDTVKPGPVVSAQKATAKPSSFIKIHGNVQYDFIHRSYVDTPFAQRDFQQHTVQASLRVTVKDKYPLKMNVATRASNSPYFRNFLDLGLQLDQYNYVKDYRQQLLNKASQQLYQSPDLKAMETTLKGKMEELQQLRARLAEPEIIQRLIEEREKRYLDKLALESGELNSLSSGIPDLKTVSEKFTHKAPSLKKISGSEEEERSYAEFIEKKKKDLDSLQQDVIRFQRKTDSVRRGVEKNIADVRKKIYSAKNKSELKNIARENEWAGEKEKGFDQFLSNIRSIGIGRSLVSYSELTAWNIALTGLNMEYNNSRIYAAIAGGRMDYGFRDFFGSNSRARQQSLFMGRFGIGDKDHKALILSVFTGRKYNYGLIQSDSTSSKVNIAGYSLEAIWKKDENTSMSVELAKTTRPVTGAFRENQNLAALFDLGDKRNLGASIKAQTRLVKTDTRVEGFLRKTGEHFQSFSLFTYNSDQFAWQLKVDQPLLNDRLRVTGSLRRNDFTHPFADKTFKTSTVFTSIQATLRVPRLPVFSVGYFPGTQLYVENKEKLLENAYYMLNASAVYQYRVGGGSMTSTAIYNRYSGKGTDSGFVAYSGINYMLGQSFNIGKFQLQGLYNFTDQERMRYHTGEAGLDYAITKNIRIGGGGKYNQIVGGTHYWGGRAQASIQVNQLGLFQLQYDKSYLPTVYGDLFAVESGRVTWIKSF
jgi:hypothetical protein